MAGVVAGNLDNMAILYERYKMALYSYFFVLTNREPEESEDLVHTVFYRVILYRNGFRGEGSFASWLFRIAHNTGITHHRKKSSLNRYKTNLLKTRILEYENNSLEKDEQQLIIRKALDKLKQEEREIIILGKIQCLKYKEIADILNITENNVKIKMFRAIRRLRNIYFNLENIRYEKERNRREIS
jgi:RNA polymerase sigma-70 factor (ECF subfamily)